MVYKLTLLKELPDYPIGSIFYMRGDKIARNLEQTKYECWDEYKLISDIANRKDWIKREETDIPDLRPQLEDLVGKKLFTLDQLLEQAHWVINENSNGGFCEDCNHTIDVFSLLGSVLAAECKCVKIAHNRSWYDGDWQCKDNAWWELEIKENEHRNMDLLLFKNIGSNHERKNI